MKKYEKREPTEEEIIQARKEIMRLLLDRENNPITAYETATNDELIKTYASSMTSMKHCSSKSQYSVFYNWGKTFIIYLLAQRGITITEGESTVIIYPTST